MPANRNDTHTTGDFSFRSPAVVESHYHVGDRPEHIDRAAPGRVLDAVPGVPDRPQKGWIAFFTGGQLLPWRRASGDHGVVGLPREAPNLEGGQQAWPNWTARTFRQAPMVPWDEGSQVGVS